MDVRSATTLRFHGKPPVGVSPKLNRPHRPSAGSYWRQARTRTEFDFRKRLLSCCFPKYSLPRPVFVFITGKFQKHVQTSWDVAVPKIVLNYHFVNRMSRTQGRNLLLMPCCTVSFFCRKGRTSLAGSIDKNNSLFSDASSDDENFHKLQASGVLLFVTTTCARKKESRPSEREAADLPLRFRLSTRDSTATTSALPRDMTGPTLRDCFVFRRQYSKGFKTRYLGDIFSISGKMQ